MAVLNEKKMMAREMPKPKQNKEDKKKTILIAQELKIARSLAGNDAVSRERALKSLKKWFRGRSENLAFAEEDFLRLWKGLFYSMWMSDKPLIQEECAENISCLLHELPLDHSLILFKCGLITLCKEWFGIDQLRLDKFLMFVRRLLRQALVVLKKNGFKKNNIISFGEVLSETVLDPEKNDILGLFMHLTEIFLEELAKVSEKELKPHLVNEFLVPFMKAFAVSDDSRKIKQIRKYIFIHLMSQSEVGLEYQERYDAWKKQGFPGTIHGMQKMEAENTDSVVDSEDEVALSENKPLDPRAGRVDVELPQIAFSAKSIADLLIKYKYVDGSKVPARKAMTLLSKQFRKLSNGVYPLGVVDLRIPKDDISDMNVRKAVNRLVKFEKKIMGDKSKTRKIKSEDSKDEPPSKKQKLPNVDKPKSATAKKGDSAMTEKDDSAIAEKENSATAETEDFGAYVQRTIHNCKRNEEGKPIIEIPRRFLKQGLTIYGDPAKSAVAFPKYLLSETGEVPQHLFEHSSGLWRVYKGSPLGPDTSLESVKTTKPEVSKKKSLGIVNGKKREDKIISKGIQKKKNLKAKNVLKKATIMKDKEIFPKNAWDEPLKEGEYELLMPAKAYVEKLRRISKKSNSNLQKLIDDSLVKFKHPNELRKEARRSTPDRMKKVRIDTSLNQSQDFEDYHSQVMSSPIVFDAERKPGKPLLKNRKTTPKNPFYRKLK